MTKEQVLLQGAPVWVREALKHLGLREIKGPKHHPVIVDWLLMLNAWWRDDETPWCGVYLAAVFKGLGYPIPLLYMRAKAWLDWGARISNPVLGCVCVLDRPGGGHVFLVVGQDDKGNLWGLGGNQGNAVTIARFARSRVLGYRLPPGVPFSSTRRLTTISGSGALSTNEA